MVQQRRDTSGAFVIAVAAGPFVLPVLGVEPGDLLFAIPLVVLPWAAVLAFTAAPRNATRTAMWRWLGSGCAAGAVAALFGLLTSLSGHGSTAGLYVGIASSGLLVLAAVAMLPAALRAVGWAGLVDAMLLMGVVVSLVTYLLLLPGIERGDVVLTAVEALDVAALAILCVGTVATTPAGVRIWLLGALAMICLGDAVAAGAAAGTGFLPAAATPLLWAVGGWCLAAAADRDVAPAPAGEWEVADLTRRGAYAQVLLPLAAIIAYPAITGLLILAGDRWDHAVTFFAPAFLLSTVVAFGRQGVLLVEQGRAAARERRLRAEAVRRNRQLEALTGLATTMTEVLDERPILERGLEALQVAARTSSSALHLFDSAARLELAATTGAWGTDRVWARPPAAPPPGPELDRRGRRHVARLPLSSHGTTLGLVTLVRPEHEGGFQGELKLLRLLVDQVAVAVQNARDYRDKLEAAIRDPLTGLYNRRFFYEAFDKEIARHWRYGTEAALAIFDIDDFKVVNDSLGHLAGDEVLQAVGRVADGLIRPSDTFARLGGEEFGLLMPETGQLDALLVAERLRTAVGRARILPGRPVTLSGGVAALPQDGTTREELERGADHALYWAKRNGKNLCAVASEAIGIAGERGPQGMLAHLHGVVAGIDAEHLHTRDHSENVASYAVAIGQALGLDPERIVLIRRAAFLHDVGKVAVPDAILSKPSGLTPEEFELIRLHPGVGATMLHHAGLHDEARWVRAHHERMDGGGYPEGLVAEQIPLEARILFVADSFEAMTSDRPYRRGMPIQDAVAELRRCSGTQFDPEAVEALAGLIEDDRLAVLALRD